MKKNPGLSAFLFLWCAIIFNAGANNKLPQVGLASYYGDRANHHRVASGERYCKDSFTAAHRTLPFGTYVKVTCLSNKKTVIVRINDRGPHRKHRIIDISGAAASVLGMRSAGVVRVKIELANNEEIQAQKFKVQDSLAHLANKPGDTENGSSGNLNAGDYKIRTGTYKTLSSAMLLKKYLAKNKISSVRIGVVKRKKHRFYRLTIGPMDEQGKEKVLKLLSNKGIKGIVIRK